MKKSDNELRTELANLNQVMPNIGSSIQQNVGILGQLLSNQPRFSLHQHLFIMLEIFYQTYVFYHARDFFKFPKRTFNNHSGRQ